MFFEDQCLKTSKISHRLLHRGKPKFPCRDRVDFSRVKICRYRGLPKTITYVEKFRCNLCINICIFFVVGPKLKSTQRNGAEKVWGDKGQPYRIACETERSNPPAEFLWTYQLLNCPSGIQECLPAKESDWRNYTLGEVQKISSNTSVLIVPENVDRMYFRCVAVNPATRQMDSVQYQFVQIQKGKRVVA